MVFMLVQLITGSYTSFVVVIIDLLTVTLPL